MAAKNTENKKRLLLIDEESDISLIVGLQRKGYKVIACESPQKAWGFVYPIRPDVIILHLERPNSRTTYALQECCALADGVPLLIAIHPSQREAFTKEVGESVLRFLYLPLKPNSVREALDGLESAVRATRPGSECEKQF